MISNDTELRQTLEQMERMYRALAALRREVSPVNPRQFALLAEGPVDLISRRTSPKDLRRESLP